MSAPTGYTKYGKPSHKPGSGEHRRQYAILLKEKEEAMKEMNRLKQEQAQIAEQAERERMARELAVKQADIDLFNQQLKELESYEKTLRVQSQNIVHAYRLNEGAKKVLKNGPFMGGRRTMKRKSKKSMKSTRRK